MNVGRWSCWSLLVLVCLAPAQVTWAQRDLKDIPIPDPEEERKTLIVADGFEVSLFAADPMLHKPIQMNFDSRGRLWVAVSEVYPQIAPGQKANDKIVILEDTDRDGVADKTTVFADGLLIPTAVEPGDGGAYVANSTELLHLKDTDGDGKADSSRIVLCGFGTEDTHHILHTFRWGMDGMLYMNQSIYIHSHIETPHGARRIGLAVAVSVLQMQHFGAVCHVSAAVTRFDRGRNQQPAGEDRGLVGNAVAVGIFQDHDLVVCLLTRSDLRIDFRHRDPQPAPWIKVHLNRLVQHRIGGEQSDFKSLGHIERLPLLFGIGDRNVLEFPLSKRNLRHSEQRENQPQARPAGKVHGATGRMAKKKRIADVTDQDGVSYFADLIEWISASSFSTSGSN